MTRSSCTAGRSSLMQRPRRRQPVQPHYVTYREPVQHLMHAQMVERLGRCEDDVLHAALVIIDRQTLAMGKQAELLPAPAFAPPHRSKPDAVAQPTVGAPIGFDVQPRRLSDPLKR